MKIGVLGGTFDPVHNGHLMIGEFARTEMDLDKVVFMPSGRHPFKDNKEITNSHARFKMLELAIESNDFFEISNFEIEKDETSYTIDTIKHLKEKYEKADIYFIIGSDILFEIEKWREFERLIELCKFIFFLRQNNEKKIYENLDRLKTKYNMNITKIVGPIFPISSSEIRSRLKEGKSIKYLVDKKVEEYIYKNKIYGE